MTQWLSSFVDQSVQCWGCGLFDRLFQIVSAAATGLYEPFVKLCGLLYAILITIYISRAFMDNAKNEMADPLFKKSIMRVFFNSIVVFGLLGAGVAVPRLITTITFEPVATITTVYTQSLVQLGTTQVEEKVSYQPEPMADDGFYRPELRDKIILLMKTTVTQFQAYIKLGLAVLDNAFSWKAFLSVGNLISHIVLFFIGLYLCWGFLKLFFKYCCYFADAIVAMAYFAFFFPLSLLMMAFKEAESVPDWFNQLGSGVGINQLKNLINAIVTLGSVVLTYTVIMAIIAKFFAAPDASVSDLMAAITTGELYAENLDTENLYAMTLMSCCVLMYVLDYIYQQIPQVTKMILSSFGVQEKKDQGEQFAKDMMILAKDAADLAKKPIKAIASSIKDKGSK